ncbi:MAG TPA: diphthine synthase [Candidatus Methanofastidiosa archaeon]|nr:diphthine synthase [Candidatus Methanofastidiosa archaeon]HPR42111.1 diphthine synthase [Candidatus Methanofastidiosa archaeon]
MLMLIGLGLDGKGISLKGLELLKEAKHVYAELYTSLLDIGIEELESIIGRRIEVLTREEVEEKELPIKVARGTDVAFLVVGDPLVATTHISLAQRAMELKIPLKVCHAASIFSAIGSTGLMLYKFGKSASIVYPEENFFPKSFYETVKENKKRGLHTLLFLDLKADKEVYMDPIDGMDILRSVDEENILNDIVVASRIGWDTERIIYGEIERLLKEEKGFFGPPPHCFVIPGDLHFSEEEYVLNFKMVRDDERGQDNGR